MGVRRVAVAGIVLAVFMPATAAAQTAGTDGNGTAQATAQIVKIGPGVGALELATTAGTAVAQVANSLAQAKAQAVDLGLVGTALTGEGCDGGEATVRPEQLPQPTIVDNRKGEARSTSDEIPVSEILGGGRETASANTTPASEATVEGIASAIASVVTVSGGRANAITRVVEKGTREAVATSSVDIDIAGLVRLENAQWRAVHRTGGSKSILGTFSAANTTAGGIAVDMSQLDPAEVAINTVLAQTGITVDLPHIEHITKPNDVIRVTPLVIELKDSPVGKAALGPLLNASREQREQLFNELTAQYCQAAGALLVGDIGLNIASGTGFLTVELGGVEATSADLELFNPFGSNDPLAAIDELLADVLSTVTGDLPSLASTGVLPPQRGAASIGPLRRVCESVSTSRRVGCSEGSALPVGIAGVVLTAAIAAADWQRRRARAA